MAGLGGALDPELAIADVVVDELSDLTVGDRAWRRGRIYTANKIVASVPQKRAAG